MAPCRPLQRAIVFAVFGKKPDNRYSNLMKFLSDIRLLILGVWFGAAVFFIGVAQNAFAVLEQRDLAGAVVGRNLSLLNYGGMAIAVLLILTSLVGMSNVNKLWL